MEKTTLSAHELCITGVFTAITAILSQMVIPLPFTPVPLTLGLAAVYFSGILLPPRTAFFCQLCYVLLGAVGLPVYHGFQGGAGVLFGPTGGYLFAYPLAAFIIACAVQRIGHTSPFASAKVFLALFAATGALYLVGTVWLQLLTGNTFSQALMLAALPFLPLDILKMAVCAVWVFPLRKRLSQHSI